MFLSKKYLSLQPLVTNYYLKSLRRPYPNTETKKQ